jgi:hypothetical protein
MVRILLILILVVSTKTASASSCCGQSPASFVVLSLDQKISVNTSYSMIESQGRIFNSNEFYLWENKKRQVQAFQLNVAGTINSNQQYFITSSFLAGTYSDSISSGRSQHLSDTQVGYTLEVLPEYSFSFWRPVVYFSLIANLPTGKSIYDDSSLSEGTDVTGHNQWGAGAGLTARKVYFPLTLTFQARSLRIFAKEFDQLQVSNFYDSSLALISNYATRFKDVSINLGLTANHLSKRKINPGSESGVMQSMTVLLGLQKPIDETWNVGLNYADQTLVGPAKNSILNRTITLNLNYNYF